MSKQNLLPVLEADVQLIKTCIAEGKMDPIDPYHMFFLIWSSTQTYAGYAPRAIYKLAA